MKSEADQLSNLCADLVSLRRFEPALLHLFRDNPAGSWIPVRQLYDLAGQQVEPIKSELVASWLPAPVDPGYAVVVFFDDESKWSLTADYHVARLLQRHPLPIAAAG